MIGSYLDGLTVNLIQQGNVLFKTPLRLTSVTSHFGSSKSSLRISSRSLMPALAQTMSMWPWSLRASSNIFTIFDHDLTSHLKYVAFGGNSVGGGLTSALTTFAPCWAKYSTVAFPIPLDPPYELERLIIYCLTGDNRNFPL